MSVVIRMTGLQHAALRAHLYPGDGFEAVAIALCGRRAGEQRHILTVRKMFPVPYDQCRVRTPDRVSWSTEALFPLLGEATRHGVAVLKIHSHPGGYEKFSEFDDASDRDLFSSVYGWMNDDWPHASAVMLPDGRMFGRAVTIEGDFEPASQIAVVGDDLHFWGETDDSVKTPEFARRHAQAFGAGTISQLQKLSVAVVGCSGTGSPTVEMLARLGVGRLVVIDPDRVEEKNLNRILNAHSADAEAKRLKVEVAERSVRQIGLGTEMVSIARSLFDPQAVLAVAECDVVFGCVDSIDGRHLLNRLAVFYNLPYLDIGVKLEADGFGGVDQICGTVHYLQPDRSSLLSRGVYTLDQVRAAGLKRINPAEYQEQVRSKYIAGVQEERPAVISVNLQYAAMAVNEFLARLHPYRDDDNGEFAIHRLSITQSQIYREPESEACRVLARHVGRGDVAPLLDMPELSEESQDQARCAA
jgi:hypothetical protein